MPEVSEPQETKDIVIYMTRHGETFFNVANRFQGWADSPLTENGEAVAADLGKGLGDGNIQFVQAYSSDSGRAMMTAELILQNNGQEDLRVHHLKDLREWYSGSFEGENANSHVATIAEVNGYSAKELMTKTLWSEFANAIKNADPEGQAEGYCSITKIIYSNGEFQVEYINDMSYIEASQTH